MKNISKNWKQVNLPFNHALADALAQQHHAVQYIAMVGKHLIPKEEDDSNTNMAYDIGKELLIGNQLNNGLRIALNLKSLEISILQPDLNPIGAFLLEGKTKYEAFEELKSLLANSGTDVTALTTKLHYPMPEHALDNGATFMIEDKSFFRENAHHRHNAEIVLHEICKNNKKAAPVKVWPHHFDTGSFIPTAYNEKGETIRSIGVGWAIADNMVKEPYFYLSFWSAEAINNFNKMSKPSQGTWLTGDWKGAVLKLSDFVNLPAADQHEQTRSFFTNGIEFLKNL